MGDYDYGPWEHFSAKYPNEVKMLSIRLRNTMCRARIGSMAEISSMSMSDWLAQRSFGPASLRELLAWCSDVGIESPRNDLSADESERFLREPGKEEGVKENRVADALLEIAREMRAMGNGNADSNGWGAIEGLAVKINEGLVEIARAIDGLAEQVSELRKT